MRRNKRETAETLATGHFGVEPNLKRIFLPEPVSEGKPDEPIKLLEVVEGTIERGIEPIAFPADPAHGIDYPSMIVEVSPREFRDICDGKLDLGDRGWMIGKELKEGTAMQPKDEDWAGGYARQALSDPDAREILVRGNAEKCHRLHFLQMAAEKTCKAYLTMTNGNFS